MFLPPLSLSRILPAVMLSSGFSNLLSYNYSLDRSPGRVFFSLLVLFVAVANHRARSTFFLTATPD
jgi:hypothetical protein